MFRTLFQNANIGIMIFDSQHRIVRENTYIQKLFGYESSELINRPILDIIAPEDQELSLKNMGSLH